jgi:hypothetical protein
VILNLVPRKKKGGGVRTSAVQEVRLQNYTVLFLELGLGGGVVPKRQWYSSTPFYRSCYRRVLLAMAAIFYLVTLAENRWQK